MDAASLLAHCLALPGAWPDNPWDHEHPVVKVGPGERGKIFAFVGSTGVGVKCGRSREVADEWLVRYPEEAGVMRYIGRSGWNDLGFGIPEDELLDAVAESYRLVTAGLPKSLRPAGWETVSGGTGPTTR